MYIYEFKFSIDFCTCAHNDSEFKCIFRVDLY